MGRGIFLGLRQLELSRVTDKLGNWHLLNISSRNAAIFREISSAILTLSSNQCNIIRNQSHQINFGYVLMDSVVIIVFAYCLTPNGARPSAGTVSYMQVSGTEVKAISPWTKWPPFANDIYRRIFMNEKFCILNPISLMFVHKGLINNKSALVQAMAWRRAGDKPLPELMLTRLTDAHMRHYGWWVNMKRCMQTIL